MRKPDNTRSMAWVMLQKFGLRGSWQILRDDVGFDLKHRINTAASVDCEQLFLAEDIPGRNRYVASTFHVIDGTIEFAAKYLDLTQCGFVDIGAGKGKALIAASRYPFVSLRGVEYSEKLYKMATDNVKRLGLDGRVRIEQACASSLELELHERVLYFFNSFTGELLESMLERIATARRAEPGIFIYVNPTETAQVSRHFRCIETQLIQPGDCEVHYFELPAGSE